MPTTPQLPPLQLEEMKQLVASWGEPGFRARQILDWRNKGILNPDEMRNLPAGLRKKIASELICEPLTQKVKQVSEDGTRKYVYALASGKTIETVYIPETERGTVCVSSQVGCILDCPFCHTGTQAFEANLSSGEIVGQVLMVMKDLRDDPLDNGLSNTVTHVVYMGMGEPLANETGVHGSLDILMSEDGLNISRRRITVSTSGLIPAIERLGEKYPVNLAISLHAATDALRNELVPINRKYPLSELRKCLAGYPLGKQRHITFEYVLLSGINDRDEDVNALARFVRLENERINLIQFNPYPGSPYVGAPKEELDRFAKQLIHRGIRATVRKSRGQDIMAACGQLKSAL